MFKALQVPLNTPTDTIRALLLQKSDTPEVGAEFDELLKRMSSFESRSLYLRFGHNVITTCSYCNSFQDFALYFLPRPIMSYLREAAFVGLTTTRRRRTAVTTLFLMFVMEMYILFTVEIKILWGDIAQPSFTIWWHDLVLNIRHILFILLPLVVCYAPNIQIPFISGPAPSSNVDTSALLVQTHQTMNHLLPVIHLVKYGQAAIMRVPELRERASSWWEEEARVGAWIRGDGVEDTGSRPSVRGVARGLGTSFDEGGEGVEEGKLRTSAKVMTKILMIDGLKPSPQQPHQEK
ncbi:hypothetical protein J132_11256 [Termitomyces sp. J132]|nr:hypothetical protein C0989_006952 [Termitomyces sp. Mn162]KAH0581878.1 hypothetical protein H2248_011562 [Termitomyces sp. 'cryptogamus']KNZ81622.1 hypothetical protein J132_11256 [Termitomyces sp. J132]